MIRKNKKREFVYSLNKDDKTLNRLIKFKQYLYMNYDRIDKDTRLKLIFWLDDIIVDYQKELKAKVSNNER